MMVMMFMVMILMIHVCDNNYDDDGGVVDRVGFRLWKPYPGILPYGHLYRGIPQTLQLKYSLVDLKYLV